MPSEAQSNKPTVRRRPGRHKLGKALGIALVLAGALLLTVVSGYYAYSASARAQLEELNFAAAQSSPPAPLGIGAELPTTNGARPSQSAASPASDQSSTKPVISVSPLA